jgi:hypothetical protein
VRRLGRNVVVDPLEVLTRFRRPKDRRHRLN